jgi:hypothetical protein
MMWENPFYYFFDFLISFSSQSVTRVKKKILQNTPAFVFVHVSVPEKLTIAGKKAQPLAKDSYVARESPEGASHV